MLSRGMLTGHTHCQVSTLVIRVKLALGHRISHQIWPVQKRNRHDALIAAVLLTITVKAVQLASHDFVCLC